MPVSDRQELIEGWEQEKLTKASVFVAGAGGLGGEIAEGLVRQGIGELHIADDDKVTATNLNRQKFTHENLWKNKAIELCKNLSKVGPMDSVLIAHPCIAQKVNLDSIRIDVIVCGIDNRVPGTRLWLCKYGLERTMPVVFIALSEDADWGYLFVQEVEKACWSCALKPELVVQSSEEDTCPRVPASCDLQRVACGFAIRAIDTLLMPKMKRDWNFRTFSMSRGEFGGARMVQKRAGCNVCS